MKFKVGDWISDDFGTFQDLVNKTLNVEAMAIERELGIPWEQVAQGVGTGMRTSVTAFVWILRKREEPTLKFGEVVWREEEFDLIVSDADKARLEQQAREAQEKSDPLSAGEEAGQELNINVLDSETSSKE